MNTIVLNEETVERVYNDSLFRENDPTQSCVPADGVYQSVWFNRDRLEAQRVNVEALLLELPDEFMDSKGDGASFSIACNDKYGSQWTKSREVVEHLVLLGIALGKVWFPKLRKNWPRYYPNGMPDLIVKD